MITYRRHHFDVTNAFHTFCADLSHTRYPGLVQFVQNNAIRADHVYIWTEIQYRTVEHPTLPQYHHQFIDLASIETYAQWTHDARQEATAERRQEHEHVFSQKYGKQPQQNAWKHRIQAAIQKLRHRS